jgi:phosphate transport system permease protein
LEKRRTREVNVGDFLFKGTTATFATVTVVILLVVAVALGVASRPTLAEYGLRFVTSSEWNPTEGREAYGALPFIFGTLVSSLLALLIAVPVSLGVAIFLAELAPAWMRTSMSFVVELLAAVPSVIYGLWGFFVLRPIMMEKVEPALGKTLGFTGLFKGAPQGNDILLASTVLAIMILPTISSVSREVLRAVPNTLREGALALGATRWDMVRRVVLPYARSGITGAVILGLGRALGETMAVTMLIGNKPQISASLFQPAATMASVIANEYPEAAGRHQSALTEIGLLLFIITLLLNVVARLLVWRVGRQPQGARA